MSERTSVPGFVTDWLETIGTVTMSDIASDPASVAVFSADMINGFLREGALASPRVDRITQPVLEVIYAAWDAGVTEFVFLQDTHDPATPEFAAYPPHSLAGSVESTMIPELQAVPFSERFTVIEKNSLNPAIGTEFDDWLDDHDHIRTAIVVGNCTDLCAYQLAMHLRMRANAGNDRDFTVIVPANAVETFDIASTDGSPPGTAHPGDFFHAVFLYHMAQNGVQVIKAIDPV